MPERTPRPQQDAAPGRPRAPWDAYARTLAVLVAALGFGAALFRTFDPDLWMHLAYGREVFARGGVPRLEPFTLANWGLPTFSPEWLFGVLAYAMERLGGIPAVTLAKATIVALTCLVLYADGRGPLRGRTSAFAFAALAVLAARPRLVERPEIFMLLFLALDVALLDRFARRGDRRVWLVPAIQVAWANLHASAILGLVVVALWLVVGVALARLGRRRGEALPGALDGRRARTLALVLAATLVASAVTPWGPAHLWAALKVALPFAGAPGAIRAGGAEADLQKHLIEEWRPLPPGYLAGPLGVLLLATALAAVAAWGADIARMLRAGRQRGAPAGDAAATRASLGTGHTPLIEGEAPAPASLYATPAQPIAGDAAPTPPWLDIDLARLIAAGAAVAMAFAARRFVGAAAVLLAPLGARYLARLARPAALGVSLSRRSPSSLRGASLPRPSPPSSPGTSLPPRSRPALRVGAFAGVAALAAWTAATSPYQPGLGAQRGMLPEGGVRYLLERGVRGALFGPLHFGGYVEWRAFPQLRPVVDGRGAAAATVEQVLAAESSPAAFAAAQQRFGFEAALLEFPRLPLRREGAPGAAGPGFVPPGWKLVYWDDASLVLLREAGPYGALARQDALDALRPVGDYHALASPRLGDPAWREAVAADARRAARTAAPLDLRPTLLLARLALASGDGRAAESLAVAASRRAAGNRAYDDVRVGSAYLLAESSEQRGDSGRAMGFYREAIRLDPGLGEARYRLGRLVEAAGRHAEAIALYRAALRLDPGLVGAAEDLVRLLRATGDEAGARAAEAAAGLAARRARALRLYHEGMAHYDAGRLEQAAASLGAAVAEDERLVPALCNLGYVLYDLGRDREALTYQSRAIELDPRCAEAHFALGLLYARGGEKERAREHFRRYLELVPRGVFSRDAEAYLRALSR
jgi:tetratricopeptide (TPR) repeat protein